MASIERLEQALRNAHNAGDVAAAKTLAAAVREARAALSPPATQAELDAQLEGLFGETAAPTDRPDPSIGDYVTAGGTAALGAVTGIPAIVAGSVEGIAGTVADGTFGTPQGAQDALETRNKRMESMTYSPSSPGAQEVLRQAGEVVEPLGYITDPLLAQAPLFSGAQQVARGGLTQALARQQQAPDAPTVPFRPGASVGAAGTASATQRAASATDTPIPMTGDRAPTLGQLTRDQVILRRERELAKNDDLGGDLRQRFDNQLEGINANLDELEQRFPVQQVEDRGIGQATAAAIDQRKQSQYGKVTAAYDKARQAGELEQPVSLGNLDDVKLATQQMESLAPNAAPIYKEAQRLGILDADGNPLKAPVGNLETLRQFVNDATDMSSRQQARFRKLWTQVIDQTIDGADVGPLYRDARRKYSQWVNEFEETPITRDVIRTKRGTNERATPYENVFQKTILGGSVDEVNKLRGTLLRSDQGKQAWTDLKGRFARHIGDMARTSNTASNDQPIISPYKLGKVIDDLDRTGKLESIFGKNGAAEVRNIREMAQSMLTVPPNTVNASGTSAALMNMLMRVGKGVPFGGRLTQAVERSGMRKEIDQSLNLTKRPDLQELLNYRDPSNPLDQARIIADRLRRTPLR